MKTKRTYRQILNILFIVCLLGTCLTAQIDSGYVDIKQGQLFYRIWGAGPPLVFLNGGPGLSSKGYENYAENIQQDRTVILFDQRGTGKSIVHPDINGYVMRHMIKDLEALRKHLGYESWDVFGHSFGGEYAQQYATKHPDRINKLILSASPSSFLGRQNFQSFKKVNPDNLTEQERELKKLRKWAIDNNKSAYVLRKYNLAIIARYYVSKPENYKAVADWFLYKSAPRSGYLEIFRLNKNKVCEALRKLNSPTLIIHGVGDFININHPMTTHKNLPNSQLKIIEDSGHIMSIDSPDAYWKSILGFLRDI